MARELRGSLQDVCRLWYRARTTGVKGSSRAPATRSVSCRSSPAEEDDVGPSTSGRGSDGAFDLSSLQRAMHRERVLEQYRMELKRAEPDLLR